MERRNAVDVEEGVVNGERVGVPNGIEAHSAEPESVTGLQVRALEARVHEARKHASICMAAIKPIVESSQEV